MRVYLVCSSFAVGQRGATTPPAKNDKSLPFANFLLLLAVIVISVKRANERQVESSSREKKRNVLCHGIEANTASEAAVGNI